MYTLGNFVEGKVVYYYRNYFKYADNRPLSYFHSLFLLQFFFIFLRFVEPLCIHLKIIDIVIHFVVELAILCTRLFCLHFYFFFVRKKKQKHFFFVKMENFSTSLAKKEKTKCKQGTN